MLNVIHVEKSFLILHNTKLNYLFRRYLAEILLPIQYAHKKMEAMIIRSIFTQYLTDLSYRYFSVCTKYLS